MTVDQIKLPDRPLTKEEFLQWFMLMRARAVNAHRFYSGDAINDAVLSWNEIQKAK